MEWECPSPGDLPRECPSPGIKPRSPALQAISLPAEPQGKPQNLEFKELASDHIANNRENDSP